MTNLAQNLPPLQQPVVTPHQHSMINAVFWVSTLCEGAASILIPLYFYAKGVNVSQISFMFFICELFALFSNLFSGYLANRYGYKTSLIVGFVMHTVASFSYLLLGADLNIITLLILVNVSRSLRGSAREIIRTIVSAYLKQNRRHTYKFATTQFSFGLQEAIKGVGIALGILLMQSIEVQWAFFFIGLMTLLCLFIVAKYIHDVREPHPMQLRSLIRVKKNMRILSFSRAFLYAGRDIWLVTVLPIYLTNIGYKPLHTGLIMALIFIVYGMNQPLGILVIKRSWRLGRANVKNVWRFRQTLVWLTAIGSIFPLIAAFYVDSIHILIFCIIMSCVVGGWTTAAHNHLHLKFAKRKRSSMDISYYKTIANIGKVLAVLVSGSLYKHWGLDGCLYASFILISISAINAGRLRKTKSLKTKLQECLDPESAQAEKQLPTSAQP